MRIHFGIASACLFLSGCAIHPIPDDVTQLSTVNIVRQIRCEAQHSIYQLLIEFLKKYDDNKSKAKLRKILDNLGDISVLSNYKDLMPIQRRIFTRYDDAIIVFDFQLRMTETNKAGVGTSIIRPFTGGADAFGFKASNNLERQNYRTFRITTTIREVMSDRCEPDQIRAPNYEYPIAGKVGLKEVFSTYFEIEFNNKLAKIWRLG